VQPLNEIAAANIIEFVTLFLMTRNLTDVNLFLK
jgi:hypothetical protein